VDVRTGEVVTRISDGAVETSRGRIECGTVLWAAGVAASPLGATLGAPLDRAGRVLVQPDLTIPGHPDVFVIGDLASLAGPSGRPLPGVAPVAMQMGAHAAGNILRAIDSQPLRPFHYKNLGDMATIGRASAVAELPWIQLQGYLAWLAWLFIHLIKLIGFRSRIVVMVQWMWAYFTYQRAIRLITGDRTDE
jgi:NADH dehydrogenase